MPAFLRSPGTFDLRVELSGFATACSPGLDCDGNPKGVSLRHVIGEALGTEIYRLRRGAHNDPFARYTPFTYESEIGPIFAEATDIDLSQCRHLWGYYGNVNVGAQEAHTNDTCSSFLQTNATYRLVIWAWPAVYDLSHWGPALPPTEFCIEPETASPLACHGWSVLVSLQDLFDQSSNVGGTLFFGQALTPRGLPGTAGTIVDHHPDLSGDTMSGAAPGTASVRNEQQRLVRSAGRAGPWGVGSVTLSLASEEDCWREGGGF